MKNVMLVLGAMALPTASAAGLTRTDTSFLAKAVRGNNYEIQAAQVALRQGHSAVVRAFAQKMITDHSKLGAAVGATVMRLDARMALPKTVTYKQADMLTALRRAGRNFDAVYRQQMVTSHAQTYALFNTYTRSRYASAALRQTVQAGTPTVKMHWQMAETLPRM